MVDQADVSITSSTLRKALLPHARSVEEGGIEEERRLAYVGITRAMRTLTLSFCSERAKYGKRAAAIPSRFPFEMRGKEPPDDWVPVEPARAEEPVIAPRTRKKSSYHGGTGAGGVSGSNKTGRISMSTPGHSTPSTCGRRT